MAGLSDLLSWIDSKKRVAGRTISDLVNNPSDSVEMLDDRAKNYNQNVQPVIQGGELSNRPLTPEEIEQKSIDLAMSVMPMGVGATVYHGTRNPAALEGLIGKPGGLKMMDGLGPHVGTAEAANERLAKNAGVSPSKAWNKPNESLEGSYIIPMEFEAQKPFIKKDGTPYTEAQLQKRLSDIAVSLGHDKNSLRAYSSAYPASAKMKQAQIDVKKYLSDQGYDAIPYLNSHEHRGSISQVILDPSRLERTFGRATSEANWPQTRPLNDLLDPRRD